MACYVDHLSKVFFGKIFFFRTVLHVTYIWAGEMHLFFAHYTRTTHVTAMLTIANRFVIKIPSTFHSMLWTHIQLADFWLHFMFWTWQNWQNTNNFFSLELLIGLVWGQFSIDVVSYGRHFEHLSSGIWDVVVEKFTKNVKKRVLHTTFLAIMDRQKNAEHFVLD